ncbi:MULTISPECIES: hypothetical protein [Loigolactobacillus]|uniref:Uncharacterized protein n=1 Tax=Loigolactobacillus backii TaxID=375175 RepID=A0A192GZH6_9LACO|nr:MULTISPECIES: hypothetical protein [Loigolactobacillus]ANK58842.1 hypothetical protein AYR52_00325 [Loigolactobacillus backii]ANK61495.1 hypothetical protein AYR53_01185 [Loigolactobacillus backii]ANK63832.1 hypothetical protein AYR54_00320 [Loigolactobacillus backii]ANK66280.1 hypothetical protein AYR55_00320 [Loigolactobacillus backii]ANK69306.1 hypothetical protein AYR56_03530 [Loigolactobacillus backii]
MNRYYKVSFYFNGGLRATYHAQFDSLDAATDAVTKDFSNKKQLAVAGGSLDTGKAVGFDVAPANTVSPDVALIWDML